MASDHWRTRVKGGILRREFLRYAGRGTRALLLSALATAACLGGCTTSPISPVYSQADRKAECDRHRGWWRPDDLRGGYCEYDSHL